MNRILLLICCVLLWFGQAVAIERFSVITTKQMKDMLDRRERGEENFILINTLDTLIANNHSIPGSINIPWNKLGQSADLLGQDKTIPVITYCMGYR